MAVIPNGFAQVNYRFVGTSLRFPAEVTLGLNVQEVSQDLSTFTVTVQQAWATNILPLQNVGITLAETTVKYGPNNTGPAYTYVSNAAGGDSGAGATSQVAYLVRKVTNAGGRSGRGRMYVPGVTEARVGSDGDLDNTFQQDLSEAFLEFVDDINAATSLPVLLHGENSPVSSPTPIVAFLTDPYVATQRRRLRR